VRTIYFGHALANTLTGHFQYAVRREPDDFVFSKRMALLCILTFSPRMCFIPFSTS